MLSNSCKVWMAFWKKVSGQRAAPEIEQNSTYGLHCVSLHREGRSNGNTVRLCKFFLLHLTSHPHIRAFKQGLKPRLSLTCQERCLILPAKPLRNITVSTLPHASSPSPHAPPAPQLHHQQQITAESCGTGYEMPFRGPWSVSGQPLAASHCSCHPEILGLLLPVPSPCQFSRQSPNKALLLCCRDREGHSKTISVITKARQHSGSSAEACICICICIHPLIILCSSLPNIMQIYSYI